MTFIFSVIRTPYQHLRSIAHLKIEFVQFLAISLTKQALFYCIVIMIFSSLSDDHCLFSIYLQNTILYVFIKKQSLLFLPNMPYPTKHLFIIALGFLMLVTCQKNCPKTIEVEQDLLGLDPECFIEKYNPDIHDGHKLQRLIDQRLAGYKKMRQFIKMKSIKAIETNPVVKWAQNQSQIFINFKLSHRQDSPPCSDITFEEFSVDNIQNVTGKFDAKHTNSQSQVQNKTSSFSFVGECLFTHQKFHYALNMTFNASIGSINIERQGFGEYILVGTKLENSIWIDPFEDVHRAAIWPELRTRYSVDMDKYFEMRENRAEENNERKVKKKRKRRPTKKAEEAQENPEAPRENPEAPHDNPEASQKQQTPQQTSTDL